jgi:hypothetical protein
MARPLKSDAERRKYTLRVRVNDSEKTSIEQNALNAGQEPSVFLRSLGTGTKPSRNVPTPDREVLLKVLAELNKNGSNLNQIARALNRRDGSNELIGFSLQDLETVISTHDLLTHYLMETLK